MASNNTVMKNLSSKSKVFLFVLISLFVIVAIFGIQKVYAYYHDSLSSAVLANQVGDFDLGSGDINMMLYRENLEGKFVRVYAVPDSSYYTFNDSLTSCTITCNDSSGNCEYSYDSTNNIFSLTSNQKVTCKFYFEQKSGVNIVETYILLEDSSATSLYTYNSKNYSLTDTVPAYGYTYANYYKCENGGTVTYNSTTKNITVSSSSSTDKCYVYFNKSGSADITVNAYVQEEYGSDTYVSANSIPGNKIYVLNSAKSKCTAVASDGVNGTVTYTDGYINVVASGQQVCDVYLDLESN